MEPLHEHGRRRIAIVGVTALFLAAVAAAVATALPTEHARGPRNISVVSDDDRIPRRAAPTTTSSSSTSTTSSTATTVATAPVPSPSPPDVPPPSLPPYVGNELDRTHVSIVWDQLALVVRPG